MSLKKVEDMTREELEKELLSYGMRAIDLLSHVECDDDSIRHIVDSMRFNRQMQQMQIDIYEQTINRTRNWIITSAETAEQLRKIAGAIGIPKHILDDISENQDV